MEAPSVAASDRQPITVRVVLIDRLVRVVRDADDGWMTVRFESDNTLQDPPMRLLPCRMLERAEQLAAGKARQTDILRVSGEVYQYKGNNYLLLRKVLPQRDMKQF